MRRLSLALAVASYLAMAVTLPAEAYFGPGAGITMLGALWGVLLAILFALGAILAWPIRALMRKRRRAAKPAAEAGAQPAPTDR